MRRNKLKYTNCRGTQRKYNTEGTEKAKFKEILSSFSSALASVFSAVPAFLILITITISSCSKDELPLDPIPKITLKEIAPTTVVQFIDSIGMVIEYEDGDGDVGYWNPDSLALSVHDLRLANPDYFYVRPLTPDSNALSITGTIRISIRNTYLLGNGDEETTNYEIKLKDRAGNWSNTVTTPLVTITR